jgi:two-component system CheB/CheR fusion protein
MTPAASVDAAGADAPQPWTEQPWLVAVGASAGGLEALQRFFSALAPPTQAAFVVIQHLSPDHRSMMSELLARHTSLPVREAVAGESLEVDHIYLMPAGVLMTIEQEHLVFTPRPLRGVSLPIDLFFRSLAGAGAGAERCIGLVLSGSGSDGASGAAALRAAGGYVMAQAPESARFDSMPRSVISTGGVDAVLPPEELAAQVLGLTQGRSGRLAGHALVATPQIKPALQRLFDGLVQHAGVDFSNYKLPTLMRRIERRMAVLGCASVTDYADRVEVTPDECEALRRELLIPVTSFFRDDAAFAALRGPLQALVRDLPAGQMLRLWSAGCATGEEAYSLAIAALEACTAVQRWPGIKVYATDVDPGVLAVGGAGSYPAGAADQLTPERQAQWFTLQDERLQVKPELRQMVLFARHNLLEDAPFTRMDAVVCRNTLIYFQADAQERVMRRLQYALNQQGLLFLGGSESLGALQADFQALDTAHKLYRLVRPVLTALAVRDGFGRSSMALRGRSPVRSNGPAEGPRLVDTAVRQLVQAYAPLTLLVTAQRQLLHAWGPTQRFLRMPEGEPQLDVIRLLPPRLGAVASHALQVALRNRTPHTAPLLQLDLDGDNRALRVVARPLAAEEDREPCVLLSIEDHHQTPQAAGEAVLSEHEVDRLGELERELAAVRTSLQTSIEELEAANEELQATNEELMSSNEELQSTNEELQSVNEELYTVNAEYNAKLDAVSALNADLDGMSQATGIATLFIDAQRQLVRFTPEAALLFRLRPSDIGRPLADFNNPLDYPELLADLGGVLAGGNAVERELTAPTGGGYLARVLGYGERPGVPRRAVLSLIDVSRLRDARRLQAVIDSLPEHVAVLDVHGSVRQVNHAWHAFAAQNAGAGGGGSQVGGPVGVGTNYMAVLARATTPDALEVLRGLQQVLSGRSDHYRVIYPCHSPTEQRWFVMHASALRGSEQGAVVSHFDITPWHGLMVQPDGATGG